MTVRGSVPALRRRMQQLIAAMSLAVALVGSGLVVARQTSHPAAAARRLATHRVAAAGPVPAPVAAGTSSAEQLRRALVGQRGHAAVAALDLKSGSRVAIDADQPFYTASVEKVDIAITLFRELSDAGRPLSDEQRDLLQRMIENSDNTAASMLWDEVGAAGGVNRCNRALGLRRTVAGGDGVWGLTRTTANDQLTLLRKIVAGRAITVRDRDFLLHLMAGVEADQRWGVSAAAARNQSAAVKDGWLPHAADDYRWIINSIGMVGHRRSGLLMVVLSNHHRSKPGGIRVVDRIARLTRARLLS